MLITMLVLQQHKHDVIWSSPKIRREGEDDHAASWPFSGGSERLVLDEGIQHNQSLWETNLQFQCDYSSPTKQQFNNQRLRYSIMVSVSCIKYHFNQLTTLGWSPGTMCPAFSTSRKVMPPPLLTSPPSTPSTIQFWNLAFTNSD